MPAAYVERISIGLLLIRKYNIFVRGTSSPCNGNHFLVESEQAKRTHCCTLIEHFVYIVYVIGYGKTAHFAHYFKIELLVFKGSVDLKQ